MTKEIELTKGYKAIVDDEDFEYLSQFRWYILNVYAYYRDGNRHIPMHKVVLERRLCRPLIKGEEADHIDHNTTNNTRNNLRSATHKQNSSNKSKRANATSRFKGVHMNKQSGKWTAMIMANGRTFYLGRFLNEEEAARKYDEQALIHFGEFANLNFPV